jgi:hypothetical protein
MKYVITREEKEEINKGNILTIACYSAKHCAIAQYAMTATKIPYKVEPSESPTGKNIFIFFLYPKTYYQAFRAGDIVNNQKMFEEPASAWLLMWEERFKAFTESSNYSGLKI